MDPIKATHALFAHLYGRPPAGAELGDTLLAFAAYAYLHDLVTVEQFQERARQILQPGPLLTFAQSIVSAAHHPWVE